MRRWRVFLAGAGLALLVVVGYVLGFHQPRQEEIARLAADTDQLRAQQAVLRQENMELEAVAAQADKFYVALARLEQLIPTGLAQDTVLEQLRAQAEGAGVALTSVTFGELLVPDGAPPSNVPGTVLVGMAVTVEAEGPYSGVTDLLRRVEVEAERALLIGTVAITEAEAGFPRVMSTWSGNAYALLPAGSPLAPVADPAAPSTETAPPQEAP